MTRSSRARPMSVIAASDPPIPETAPPPIAEEEFGAVCLQCTTRVKWIGPITDDMIARTFTRGIHAETGMPNCPRCGTAMERVFATPVEVAASLLTTAVSNIVDEALTPRQATIPGLRPPFDYRSAFESIIEQRREVRRAEAFAESKHKDASRAKKDAEELQAALSQLEDEFEDRAAEAIAAPETQGCAFERETGTPCPICAEAPAGEVLADRSGKAHLAVVVRQLAAAGDLRAADLQRCLDRVAGLAIDRGVIETWTIAQQRQIATWLDLPEKVGFPKALGKPHEKGDDGRCRTCGVTFPEALLPSEATRWGIDCRKPRKGRTQTH